MQVLQLLAAARSCLPAAWYGSGTSLAQSMNFRARALWRQGDVSVFL